MAGAENRQHFIADLPVPHFFAGIGIFGVQEHLQQVIITSGIGTPLRDNAVNELVEQPTRPHKAPIVRGRNE